MARTKQKQMFMSQEKPYIIDKEQRIVKFKASNGDYDSDNDRINPKSWRLRKGASFIDGHKSSGTVDNKLGEIVKAYVENNIWYNEVKLKNPTIDAEGDVRDPAEWTEGEKLANSMWNEICKGEDVRVSVGFMYDPNKVTTNDKGGYDFDGQTQYELSSVIVPANEEMGLKQANQEKAIDYDSIPKSEIDLKTQLYKAVKETYPNKSCYIESIRTNTFILNMWGDDENGKWYDKWYEIGYTINELTGVTLSEDKTEVTDVQVWTKKEFEKAMQDKDVVIEKLTNRINELTKIVQKNNVDFVKKSLKPKKFKNVRKLKNNGDKKTVKKIN